MYTVTVNNVWLGISVYVEFDNPVKCDMAFAVLMQHTYCDVVHGNAVSFTYSVLTHRPLVPHICVSELGHHWFRQWLVPWPAPSHYLNQCSLIVNKTCRNKLKWNLKQNTKLSIQENAFENVVRKMSAILSRPQCVSTITMEWRPKQNGQHHATQFKLIFLNEND